MATITGSAYASLDLESAKRASFIPGLLAGAEGVAVGMPCYITGAYAAECVGSSGTVMSQVAGFAARNANFGEPVTLYREGAIFQLNTGLTPGSLLFISATRGRLEDAATAGDKMGVALVITTEDFIVTRCDGIKAFTNAL